jgi:hypothetical protein
VRRRDTPLHLTGVHAGASGWEKGQVENQVGLVRERFFTPRLRFKSYDEMSAWLLDKCIAYAKGHGAAALHLPRSRRRRERIVGQASPRAGEENDEQKHALRDDDDQRPDVIGPQFGHVSYSAAVSAAWPSAITEHCAMTTDARAIGLVR